MSDPTTEFEQRLRLLRPPEASAGANQRLRKALHDSAPQDAGDRRPLMLAVLAAACLLGLLAGWWWLSQQQAAEVEGIVEIPVQDDVTTQASNDEPIPSLAVYRLAATESVDRLDQLLNQHGPHLLVSNASETRQSYADQLIVGGK